MDPCNADRGPAHGSPPDSRRADASCILGAYRDDHTDELAGYLNDRPAAEALVRWGAKHGWTPCVPARQWTHRGLSGAAVFLMDLEERGERRKVVMKLTPPADGPRRHEPSAYDEAKAQCPPAFEPRLVLESEPACTTPQHARLTFQQLAGNDVHSCRPARKLPDPQHRRLLRLVPAALLRDWNGGRFRSRRQTIIRTVSETLGGLQSARGSLFGRAGRIGLLPDTSPWITYDDGIVYPNPLLLAEDQSPTGRHEIDLFVGHSHRDLHLDNIMVPDARRGEADPERFQLIDLDTYRADWSLTADPVYLLLAAVAEALPATRFQDWDAMADAVLARPGHRRFDPVHAVLGGAEDVVLASTPSLLGDWRRQMLVATIGTALVYTTFSDLGPRVRAWFFQLAARAGRLVLQELGTAIPANGVRVGRLFDDPADEPKPELEPERVEAPAVDRILAEIWSLPREPGGTGALFRKAYRVVADIGAAAAIVPVLRALHSDATRRLGPDDPTTLELLHNLGYWTYLSGDPQTARLLLDEAWRRRADTLGPAHLQTLQSRRAAGDPRLFRGDG